MKAAAHGVVLAALALAAAPAAAQPALPAPLRAVGFEQRLGDTVPGDAAFRDHTGAEVTLSALLGERPAILALVYYDCPMLCSLILNGLTQSLRTLAFDVGDEFDVVVVSFDPRETPTQAAALRAGVVERYGRPGSERGWHFLTGEPPAIARLTEAVGFSYNFVEESGEFAHAAGVVLLTPEGRIARYHFGVEYAPRDLRLGLVEAADGKIGSLVDGVLLYCFRYDPSTGKYGLLTLRLVRLGGVLTVLALGLFLTVSLRRERRRGRSER